MLNKSIVLLLFSTQAFCFGPSSSLLELTTKTLDGVADRAAKGMEFPYVYILSELRLTDTGGLEVVYKRPGDSTPIGIRPVKFGEPYLKKSFANKPINTNSFTKLKHIWSDGKVQILSVERK